MKKATKTKPNAIVLALLFSVFVIATCGLVYELIAGTIASYLLGDSITQFSIVIGVYMFSMGLGSYVSRYVERNLEATFIQTEILIGLIGGCSAAILFSTFELIESFHVLLYTLIGLTGVLVGLEIPLLMRILKRHFEFRDLVSQVFTFDYIGALIASILFPLLLVPHLGIIRTAFLFGMFNVIVAIWGIQVFKRDIGYLKTHQSFACFSLIVLILGFIYSNTLMSFAEKASYPDKVIYAKSTPYQRIVITKAPNDLRLFLNGNLQFSSRDEYRYHEALVHVGLASVDKPKDVLVLGGGDGLAIREILKYPTVRSVTLVDLDPQMTQLFTQQPILRKLNRDAFHSPKVKVIVADAFSWLRKNQKQFDFITVDFPDPGNFSIGKLYTDTFYRVLKRSLKPNGALVVQSTSPYYAKQSFWCVANTLKSVGLKTWPYHAYVPSFGDWGYVLATRHDFQPSHTFPTHLRYISATEVPLLFHFPNDMLVSKPVINRLNNQLLVHYFEKEWAEYGTAH